MDGCTRLVERHGRTKTSAKNELADALAKRGEYRGGSERVSRETRMRVLIDMWWKSFMKEPDRSINTEKAYSGCLSSVIRPAIGELLVYEVDAACVAGLLAEVSSERGGAMATRTRTLLMHICQLAVQHKAMTANPVRDCKVKNPGRKKSGNDEKGSGGKPSGRSQPRALSLPNALKLKSGVASDKWARSRDLPDVVALMLATGLRIGECLGLEWDSVDLEVGSVEVCTTVVRKTGVGLVLQRRPKTPGSEHVLRLPLWATEVLRRRHAVATGPMVFGPLPTARGKTTLRDPNEVEKDLTKVATSLGFGWLTSHALRKTVATLMENAGKTPLQIADQLRHENVTTTMDTYLGRHVLDTGAAEVLEALAA
jgi:integrase